MGDLITEDGLRPEGSEVPAPSPAIASFRLLPPGPARFAFLETPAQAPPLRVERDGLWLPRSVRSAKEEWVPFEELTRLEIDPRHGGLFIRSKRRTFLFPRSAFVDPSDVRRFDSAAREAIRAQDPRRLERMAQERELASTVARVRPLATWALAVLIAAVFGVTELLGGPTSAVLVRLGANAPVLDRDGQWFRLFTANLLHGGFLHLYLNGMALMSLGAIEQLFGTPRFLVVFLLSALGGSAASTLNATHPFSVGISTALFGLLGAWVFAAWRFRSNLPANFRRSLWSWIALLGVNGALSFLPFIDWAAHLGGFVTGIASTAMVFWGTKQFGDAPGSATKIGAAALVVAFAGAVGLGALHALGPPNPAEVAHAIYDLPKAAPGSLNSLAWEAAIDPKSDLDTLASARKGIDRAVAGAPGEYNILDTSATIRHRLGDAVGAVSQECEALRILRESKPDCSDCRERRVFSAQLARFMRERLGEGQTGKAGALTPPLEVEHVDAEWSPESVTLLPPAAATSNLHAYALLRRSVESALVEFEGDVSPAGSKVDAVHTSVPWPSGTGSQLPAFGCVEWEPPSGKQLSAHAAVFDRSVKDYP